MVGADLAQGAVELGQDGATGRVGDRTTLARSEAALAGDLDPVTDAAVKSFQTDYHLTADGVWGVKTEALMRQIMQARYPRMA